MAPNLVSDDPVVRDSTPPRDLPRHIEGRKAPKEGRGKLRQPAVLPRQGEHPRYQLQRSWRTPDWPHMLLVAYLYSVDEWDGVRIKAWNDRHPRECLILTGICGVGKTEVAIDSFYSILGNCQNLYAGFWIDASEPEGFEAGYAAIARAVLPDAETRGKDVPELMEAARAWMLHPERLWILFLDDVRDPSVLRKYWPEGNTGTVIITSRRRDLRSSLPAGQKINEEEVWPVDREEAARLFNGMAALDKNDSRYEAADVQHLGGLPLAIETHASVVDLQRLKKTIYLKHLDGKCHAWNSMRFDGILGAYSRPLGRYGKSFSEALRLDELDPIALRLLRLLSHLDTPIMPSYLTKEASSDPSRQPQSQLLGEEELMEGICVLSRESLIAPHLHRGMLYLNAAVANEVWAQIPANDKHIFFTEILGSILRHCTSDSVQNDVWPKEHPNAQNCTDSVVRWCKRRELPPTQDLLNLLQVVGFGLIDIGVLEKGKDFLEEALRFNDELRKASDDEGPDHVAVDIHIGLARAAGRLGNIKACQGYAEAAMKMLTPWRPRRRKQQKAKTEDAFLRLAPAHEVVGLALLLRGKTKKALKELEKSKIYYAETAASAGYSYAYQPILLLLCLGFFNLDLGKAYTAERLFKEAEEMARTQQRGVPPLHGPPFRAPYLIAYGLANATEMQARWKGHKGCLSEHNRLIAVSDSLYDDAIAQLKKVSGIDHRVAGIDFQLGTSRWPQAHKDQWRAHVEPLRWEISNTREQWL